MNTFKNTSTFVCWGLMPYRFSLLAVKLHIATEPASSSGSLTNVLPHRNAMPQTWDTTPHPTPSIHSISTPGQPVMDGAIH